MVKNGFYSSFPVSSLIWACLRANLAALKDGISRGFHQTLKKSEFSINC
jgi:hypothetical protein